MSDNLRLITFIHLLMRDVMPIGTIIRKIEEIDEAHTTWLNDVPELDSQMLVVAKELADLITYG